MKKVEIQGLGVHIEIYKRKEQLTDLEVLKEAEKAIRRMVMKYEQHINLGIDKPTSSDQL